MRDHNGDHVAPEDVLDAEQLADYYRGRRRPQPTGYEGVSLGADPAVVAWQQAMAEAAATDEHIDRGEN